MSGPGWLPQVAAARSRLPPHSPPRSPPPFPAESSNFSCSFGGAGTLFLPHESRSQAYYVLVDAVPNSVPSVGVFELSVACEPILSKPVKKSCSNDYVTCGDVVKAGINIDYPSVIGSKAGDVVYMLAGFKAQGMIVNTCSEYTNFEIRLRLFRYHPFLEPEPELLAESALGEPCAVLWYTYDTAASYYLVVDGVDDQDEGMFELNVLCTPTYYMPEIVAAGTRVPSAAPTPVTPFPTVSCLGATYIGDAPRPAVSLSPGATRPGYPLASAAAAARYGEANEYTRPFTLSGAVPGSSGNVEVRLGKGASVLGTGAGFVVARHEVKRVDAVVKTPTLYVDQDSVQVGYQLRDADGRTNVFQGDGLSVRVRITAYYDADVDTQTSECGAPDPRSGIGTCTHAVGAAQFRHSAAITATATVLVFYSGERLVAFTPIHHLVLTQVPGSSDVDEETSGMTAALPLHPLRQGETFTLHIKGTAAAQSLVVWGVRVGFDPDYLEYVSTSTGSAFQAAIVNAATPGTVVLSSGGHAMGAKPEDTTGAGIDVCAVTLRVKSGVLGGTAAVEAVVLDMVNYESVSFVTNAAVPLRDRRGGGNAAGRVDVVDSTTVAGVFAFPPGSGEVWNTAPLTGKDVDTRVSATCVPQWGADYDCSEEATCVLEDRAAHSQILSPFASGGCVVRARSTFVEGSPRVDLRLSHGRHNASVAFAVRTAESAVITVTDATLNLIDGMQSAACAGARYQRSHVSVAATFMGPPGPSALSRVSDVDVTELVELEIVSDENESVCHIESVSGGTQRHVVGTAPGRAALRLKGSVGLAGNATAEVVVTDNVTKVEALYVSAVTGVTVVGLDAPTIAVAQTDQIAPSTVLLQELSAEGDRADVFGVVLFDDGWTEDVSSELDLVSIEPSSIGVRESVFGDASHSLEVLVGANSLCGPALAGTWTRCGVPLAAGNGSVSLILPSAVSARIAVSSGRLARASDPAATAPFSVSTGLVLSVIVRFSDGSERAYEDDPRSQYHVTVVNRTDAIAVVNGKTVVAVDTPTSNYTGTATVHVAFTVHDVTASVDFEVVAYNGRESLLSVYPHPPFPGMALRETMSRVTCTGEWQRARLSLQGVLTDGTALDVTPYAVFSDDDRSVLVSDHTLVAVNPAHFHGAGNLTGVYRGVVSAMYPLWVADRSANITHIKLTSPVDTLSGFQGVEALMRLRVFFDDGTEFPNAVSGPSVGWVPVASMASFNTTDLFSITMSELGAAKLKDNYYSTVTVFANASVCPRDRGSSVVQLFANIEPEYHELDIGEPTGAPVEPMFLGGIVTLQVRVNTKEYVEGGGGGAGAAAAASPCYYYHYHYHDSDHYHHSLTPPDLPQVRAAGLPDRHRVRPHQAPRHALQPKLRLGRLVHVYAQRSGAGGAAHRDVAVLDGEGNGDGRLDQFRGPRRRPLQLLRDGREACRRERALAQYQPGQPAAGGGPGPVRAPAVALGGGAPSGVRGTQRELPERHREKECAGRSYAGALPHRRPPPPNRGGRVRGASPGRHQQRLHLRRRRRAELSVCVYRTPGAGGLRAVRFVADGPHPGREDLGAGYFVPDERAGSEVRDCHRDSRARGALGTAFGVQETPPLNLPPHPPSSLQVPLPDEPDGGLRRAHGRDRHRGRLRRQRRQPGGCAAHRRGLRVRDRHQPVDGVHHRGVRRPRQGRGHRARGRRARRRRRLQGHHGQPPP